MEDYTNLVVVVGDKVSDARTRGKEYCSKCDIEVWSLYTHKHCPKCDASPQHQEVRNHSIMWGDGDVHCTLCGTFVRSWDSG